MQVALYLAASVEDDRQITSNPGQSFQQSFTEVIQKFLALHSEVLVQTAVYKDKQLTEQLRLQDNSGLGPDLIFSSGEQANALRFWVANPMDNVGICNEVNQTNWKAFKQNNIEIPFPQQVEYSMVWPPEDHTPQNTRN